MKPSYFLPITEIQIKAVREHIGRDELVSEDHNLILRNDPSLELGDLRTIAQFVNEKGSQGVFEAMERLKTEPASEVLGPATNLSNQYLSDVGSEIASDTEKVVNIDAFLGMEINVIAALNAEGMADSRACYLALRDRPRRQRFAARNNLKYTQVQDAFSMTELFQVAGITTQLASLLVRCGVRSAGELSKQNPAKLHIQLKEQALRMNTSFPYNEHDVQNFISTALMRIIARGED